MAFVDGMWSGVKKGLSKGRDLLDSASKADPKLLELVDKRLREQDNWNDVFSTKLIELLDKSDSTKAEIRQKLKALEEASRSQAELICAADEHRLLAGEYQKSSRILVNASQKYVQATELQFEAGELKVALKEESAAREQLLRAFGRAEALQVSLVNFGQEYERLNAVERDLISRASSLIGTAEQHEAAAKKEHADALQSLASALHRETEAGEKNSSAQHAHTEAARRLVEAAKRFDESTSLQNSAETKRKEAEELLQSATGELRKSISKQSQAEAENVVARESYEAANQALTAAKSEHTAATGVLERALSTAAEAESKHREAALAQELASSQLRTARRLVIACVAGSGVAAAWGVYFGTHSVWPYSWLAPTILTAFAVAFPLVAWRRTL